MTRSPRTGHRRTIRIYTYLTADEWEPFRAAAARLGCSRSVLVRRALAAGLPLVEDRPTDAPAMPEWEAALSLFPLADPDPGDTLSDPDSDSGDSQGSSPSPSPSPSRSHAPD